MTSSRKVKLQDRGTPEPKPSRKVVLDELLRSLQDLVTHELAVDVPLDENPAVAAAPATEAALASPETPTAPASRQPETPELAPRAEIATPRPAPTATAAVTAPAIEPRITAPAREVEPKPRAPTVNPTVAKPGAKTAAAPLPAAELEPAAGTPKVRAPAAAASPKAAEPAPKPLALATEPGVATPDVGRKAAERAPDPAMTAQPRRGKLGDTVVLTPRDIPPPLQAAPKRSGRPAVVETPVPAEGLQQQLPYLDVSPPPAGTAPDTGLLLEPDSELPDLPATGTFTLALPATAGGALADGELLAEPEIEIPDLPSAGAMTGSPATRANADRAKAMETDGPDELPGLDHGAAPATMPTSPAALSVTADDTGPSDIPLLEDAIDLDEHVELSSAMPPVPAASDEPRRLAIQLAARLNVELRREGRPVLGSDVIARLAKLLEESLAKGTPNMENTRPKKP